MTESARALAALLYQLRQFALALRLEGRSPGRDGGICRRADELYDALLEPEQDGVDYLVALPERTRATVEDLLDALVEERATLRAGAELYAKNPSVWARLLMRLCARLECIAAAGSRDFVGEPRSRTNWTAFGVELLVVRHVLRDSFLPNEGGAPGPLSSARNGGHP